MWSQKNRLPWLGAAMLVFAAGVALILWPRRWEVRREDGSVLCTITKGWPSAEVRRACGDPSADRHAMVAQSLTRHCSAPCEVRGQRLVFYGCDGNVASVEPVTREWQGCVLGTP